MSLLRRQAMQMLGWLQGVLPGDVAAGGGEAQSRVVSIAREILAKVPKPFDIAAVRERYPTAHTECMNTVLVQELVRYNRLIVKIRASLTVRREG